MKLNLLEPLLVTFQAAVEECRISLLENNQLVTPISLSIPTFALCVAMYQKVYHAQSPPELLALFSKSKNINSK